MTSQRKAAKAHALVKKHRDAAGAVLLRLLVFASGSAMLMMGFDLGISTLSADFAQMASVIALVVSVGMFIVLVRLEVKAYRSLLLVRDTAFRRSERLLIGAALWFLGGLPLCLINCARCVGEGFDAANPPMVFFQAALSGALVLFAGLVLLSLSRPRESGPKKDSD